MRRPILLLALCLLAAVPLRGAGDEAPPGGSIRIEPASINFGIIGQGTRVERAFKVRNAGTGTLTITGVRSTCGCTVAEVSQKSLSPGAEAVVKVTFDSAGKKGPQHQKIYIHSNDPASPISQVELTGTVRSDKPDIYPRGVDFGQLRPGETPFRDIQVFDFGNDDLQVQSAVSDSPFVTCRVKEIGTKEHPRYAVAIGLTGGIPDGEFKSKVTVTTNHPKEPIAKIPVSATVGKVPAAPAPKPVAPPVAQESLRQIFFNGAKKGQESKQTLTISSSKPFEITGVECPLKWMKLESSRQKDGSEHLVTLTLTSDAPPGIVNGDAFLRTTDPSLGRVRLKVYGRVE